MANLTLYGKLQQIEARYEDMNRELSSPEVHDDSARYQKVAKAHSELGEIVAKYREWKDASSQLDQARAMLADSDPEMREMANAEVVRLEPKLIGVFAGVMDVREPRVVASREQVRRELGYTSLSQTGNPYDGRRDRPWRLLRVVRRQ